MPGRTVGRITTRAAFSELQRSRARGASGPVRVSFVAVPAAGAGHATHATHATSGDSTSPAATSAGHPSQVFPQVGYAIGRRCGSAVTRNRLRRRARAVVRAEAPSLPRGRYLVRLEPGATGLSAAAFRSDVATALHRAGRGAAAR